MEIISAPSDNSYVLYVQRLVYYIHYKQNNLLYIIKNIIFSLPIRHWISFIYTYTVKCGNIAKHFKLLSCTQKNNVLLETLFKAFVVYIFIVFLLFGFIQPFPCIAERLFFHLLKPQTPLSDELQLRIFRVWENLYYLFQL